MHCACNVFLGLCLYATKSKQKKRRGLRVYVGVCYYTFLSRGTFHTSTCNVTVFTITLNTLYGVLRYVWYLSYRSVPSTGTHKQTNKLSKSYYAYIGDMKSDRRILRH